MSRKRSSNGPGAGNRAAMSRLKSRLNESRYQSRFQPRYHSRFEVVISDYTSSIGDWRKAQRAAKKKLPVLSEEQKQVAAKLGITEDAYARSVLAGQYGANTMQKRATALGEIVGGIIAEVNRKCEVTAVIAEMFKGRWIVKMRGPGESFAVAVPRELADDILDSGVTSEVRKLRDLVRDAVERAEVEQ
jgi:hypothetical protein